MRMGHLIFLTQTGQNKRNGETYYDQREGKCAGNRKKSGLPDIAAARKQNIG